MKSNKKYILHLTFILILNINSHALSFNIFSELKTIINPDIFDLINNEFIKKNKTPYLDSIKKIKNFIKEKKVDLNKTDKKGATPLAFFCINMIPKDPLGFGISDFLIFDLIKFFLENTSNKFSKSPNNTINKRIKHGPNAGWAPLHLACLNLACRYGCKEIIKLLLKNGANVNLKIKNTDLTAIDILINELFKKRSINEKENIASNISLLLIYNVLPNEASKEKIKKNELIENSIIFSIIESIHEKINHCMELDKKEDATKLDFIFKFKEKNYALFEILINKYFNQELEKSFGENFNQNPYMFRKTILKESLFDAYIIKTKKSKIFIENLAINKNYTDCRIIAID
ncbi:MAG: hypothetical protein UR12_C0043G0010 [candidate division TM6 bacterium GW2011_GWF2_30_66]|jgi:ankyrin repeat protein|nr:MAG: hypothetical protein UR12_C0043G0010 [candidate division TM6 bacterium GW2011_GWF2_30_66]